jgi:hypothetical protein
MDLLMGKFGQDWDPAQLGLIEGSKVSSFAAELLLAPICEEMTARGVGQVINYADNFLLMAKSNSELRELRNILRKGLHTHPAGPLQVKDLLGIQFSNGPFIFLGYKFSPVGNDLVCTWGPKAETNARKMRREGHRLLSSKMPETRKEIAFQKLKEKHLGIVNAFPEWLEGPDLHRKKMQPLERHLHR